MNPVPPPAGGRRPVGVVILTPGGRLGGGGMGTVSNTMADNLALCDPPIPAFIIDPRGDGRGWLWPVFSLAAACRIVALRLTGKADLLHVQVSERSSFARKGLLLVLGSALGMKTVLHHHGAELIPFFRNASPQMRAWVRWIVRRADLNIVLGRKWETFLGDEIGDIRSIAVLHNGSRDIAQSIGRLSDRSAGPAKAAPERFRLLILANLIPRKGVGELLRAVAVLVDRGRDVVLTLAGGGEIDRYKEEALALGIADRCTFLGLVTSDRIAGLLAEADAFVLPSYEEGLPMAILEALSAEVPVVATPVGSIPEVLTDGEACLLTQPGDVEALAGALDSLVLDPGLRLRLAANGRTVFDQGFRADAFVQKLVGLYGGVLSDEPSGTDRRAA